MFTTDDIHPVPWDGPNSPSSLTPEPDHWEGRSSASVGAMR